MRHAARHTLLTVVILAFAACDGSVPDPAPEAAEGEILAKRKGSSCAVANGGCDANAVCTQTKKKVVSCTCKAGYTGDGLTCTTAGIQIRDFSVSITPAVDCTNGFGGLINWTGVAEPGLARYLVQTSTEGAAYVERDNQLPRGAGSRYESRFGLFDSGGKTVVFRLAAELSDGSRQVLATSTPLAVPPNPCQ